MTVMGWSAPVLPGRRSGWITSTAAASVHQSDPHVPRDHRRWVSRHGSELAFGKEETNPPHTYEYVVSLTPDTDCESGGQYLLAFTRREFPGEYEQNKAVLDLMMQSIEVRSP